MSGSRYNPAATPSSNDVFQAIHKQPRFLRNHPVVAGLFKLLISLVQRKQVCFFAIIPLTNHSMKVAKRDARFSAAPSLFSEVGEVFFQGFFEDTKEQVLLALDVVVKGAGFDSRGSSQLAQGHRFVTVTGNQIDSGVFDRVISRDRL